MRLLLLVLVAFPLTVWGQAIESEKNDTIRIDTNAFPTYNLTFNNYNTIGSAKVFVVPIKSFDSLKKLILKHHIERKQEYNEYYILGVYDRSQTKIEIQALTAFLNQIDSSRMAKGGSTFLRQYNWDNVSRKITYLPGKNKLKQVSNLYYLNSTKDLCKYMACRDK